MRLFTYLPSGLFSLTKTKAIKKLMVFISKKPGICASNAAKHIPAILLIKDCDTKIHDLTPHLSLTFIILTFF